MGWAMLRDIWEVVGTCFNNPPWFFKAVKQEVKYCDQQGRRSADTYLYGQNGALNNVSIPVGM